MEVLINLIVVIFHNMYVYAYQITMLYTFNTILSISPP